MTNNKTFKVELPDTRPYEDAFPNQEYFANFGFLVSSEDIMLWTSPYIIKKGQYIVDSAALLQTVLIQTDYSAEEKRRMHDNDFISTGFNQIDYYQRDELKITEESDKITYALGGREFTAHPPVWHIKGSHAGVNCDLTLNAVCPGFLHWPFKDLKTTKKAYYGQFLTAEGTLEVEDKKLDIKGYACHDHVVIGPGFDMIENMQSPGFNWLLGFSPELSYNALTMPREGTGNGFVLVGDQVIESDNPKAVTSETLAYWDDPRSEMRVPCKWHFCMSTAKGLLNVTITAFARAYYVYVREKGYVLIYFLACSGDGAFMFPDGRVVRSENMQCLVQRGITFLKTR